MKLIQALSSIRNNFSGTFVKRSCFFINGMEATEREPHPINGFTKNYLSTFEGESCGRVVKLKDSSDAAVVNRAAKCLRSGKIIALPTDTIYGIAGLAQNSDAIREIYDIKGRDPSKPIAVCIGDISDIYSWSNCTASEELLKKLLPGPVTLVFQRKPALNPGLNPETDLIGFRIPDNPFIISLARTCQEPIALTSANRSGEKSCLQVSEFSNLWPRLDLVVDGGQLGTGLSAEIARLGSTVVDLSKEGQFTIIRPGSAFDSTTSILRSFGWADSSRKG